MAIDVQQATMDVHLTEETDFSEGILQDYFAQILNKKEYSINDLLIIDLYLFYIHVKDYDEKVFLFLFDKLVEQVDTAADIELLLLNKMLLIVISVFMEQNQYDRLIEVTTVSNRIMQSSQDYQKKPVIDMYEGKYRLFAQKEIDKAKQKYIEGAKFAEMMGDLVLSQKILKEWEMDLAIFKQQDSSSN